ASGHSVSGSSCIKRGVVRQRRTMHAAIGSVRGDPLRAGLQDQPLEPPPPAKLVRHATSERGELIFVAEIPTSPTQNIFGFGRLQLDVREHRVGGQKS